MKLNCTFTIELEIDVEGTPRPSAKKPLTLEDVKLLVKTRLEDDDGFRSIPITVLNIQGEANSIEIRDSQEYKDCIAKLYAHDRVTDGLEAAYMEYAKAINKLE